MNVLQKGGIVMPRYTHKITLATNQLCKDVIQIYAKSVSSNK